MKLKVGIVLLSVVFFIGIISCKHYPFLVSNENLIDTSAVDTSQNPPPFVGIPCNPDTVYFDSQVLPIFLTNCAMTGCHNSTTHAEGYNLSSYTNIMSHGIHAFQPTSGNIMNKILDGEMPPSSYPDLTPEQIALLQLWIQQGCLNNHCDELCDTSNVTFSGTIQPMMQNYCVGCHNANSQGGNIRLDAYSYVYAQAMNNGLINSVTGNGVTLMPKGTSGLPNCMIDEINIWINAGAPNN